MVTDAPAGEVATGVETLLVAGLRGFCAGVVRAIDVVERALEVCEGPVYVRKEIIHNRYVVEELRAKGAKFVEEVEEVPDGSWLIYSAHEFRRRSAIPPPPKACARSTQPARS